MYPAIAKNDYPHLVLNFTKDAYLLVDNSLNIRYFNDAALKGIQLCYNKTIQEGMPVLDLVPEERRPVLKAIYLAVLSGKEERSEVKIELPDKPPVHYENLFTPAFNEQGTVVGVVVRSLDISKKETGIPMREAEERWRFALEAANQGAWDWNMLTDEVIYSGSYKKMYGFGNDELKSHLSEWLSRVHPDDRKRMKAAIGEHLRSGENYYESTYRLQIKNGDYRWILARGKLVDMDKDGRPLRMIGTHTDITEIKETQEKLNTIAERFAYAAKATGQAIWEWNALSGEVYMSPSFTELFGWVPDEKNHFEQWHQFIHAEDQKQTVADYYNTLKNPEARIWQAEYRFLKADGGYAIVSDKAYILRNNDGEAVKVIGAMQDITVQKMVEEELYKSNERFDIMMMATNELLWDWDIQANQIYRSTLGVKKVYGLDDDRSIQKIEEWLKRVHPDDRPKLQKVFASLEEAAHHQTFEVEYRFQKGNGEDYIHISNRGILVKNEAGKPLRLIGAAKDITERKRLESELLKNELEYKKLINQATVDSQEQERGEIGKELHDNVNQVLTTTRLYLELALANQDLMKELVKKSSKNISTIINEIRLLSRSLMDPSLGDLGIVDSINDLIENINLTRKVLIISEIAEDIENLLNKAQKLTIFRIIQESLNNVLKHAKAKNVSIYISHENEIVNLIIADDGIGFFPESIKKGAGLKNITNRVYLIDGTFYIVSKPGEGCQIRVSFPIK